MQTKASLPDNWQWSIQKAGQIVDGTWWPRSPGIYFYPMIRHQGIRWKKKNAKSSENPSPAQQFERICKLQSKPNQLDLKFSDMIRVELNRNGWGEFLKEYQIKNSRTDSTRTTAQAATQRSRRRRGLPEPRGHGVRADEPRAGHEIHGHRCGWIGWAALAGPFFSRILEYEFCPGWALLFFRIISRLGLIM